jgi:hypothetical protein
MTTRTDFTQPQAGLQGEARTMKAFGRRVTLAAPISSPAISWKRSSFRPASPSPASSRLLPTWTPVRRSDAQRWRCGKRYSLPQRLHHRPGRHHHVNAGDDRRSVRLHGRHEDPGDLHVAGLELRRRHARPVPAGLRQLNQLPASRVDWQATNWRFAMRKASATYHAPDGDSKEVEIGGLHFRDGEPVEINSDEHPHLMDKLQGNQHFEFEGRG